MKRQTEREAVFGKIKNNQSDTPTPLQVEAT